MSKPSVLRALLPVSPAAEYEKPPLRYLLRLLGLLWLTAIHEYIFEGAGSRCTNGDSIRR